MSEQFSKFHIATNATKTAGKHVKGKVVEAFTTDEVFRKSEIDANKLTATVLLLSMVLFALTFVCNELGVYGIDPAFLNPLILRGIILLFIPWILCVYFKGERRWLKYLMVPALTLAYAGIDGLLTYSVTLIMAIPVIISTRYYSKKLTAAIALFTIILFGLSAGYSNMMQNYMTKLLPYIIITFIAIKIAARGHRMVIDQDKVSKEHARVETELDVARTIQERALPIIPTLSTHPEFDLAASMDAAKEVGGDFYDFFFLDPTHLALLIADVSGKGVPASLLMMVSKIYLDNAINTKVRPGQVLAEVNHQLCEKSLDDMFVTAWLGILDLESGKLITANAGHEYPIICRAGGKFEVFKDKHGLVLGGMDGMRYRETEFLLRPGDTIFVYTDGVPEANNRHKEQFGLERTIKTLNQIGTSSMAELIKGVKNAVDTFAGEEDQFDDLTMLALRFDSYKSKDGISFLPNREEIPKVESYLEEQMEASGISIKLMSKLNIAVDEILTNIVDYSGANWAEAVYQANELAYTVILRDNGIPYNPLQKEDPDTNLNAEERALGGLGIFMTKKLMDDVSYRYVDGKNEVVLSMNK